jgi:hypothetical protein
MLLGDRYRRVENFSLVDALCRPEFFEGDLTEEVAMALHAHYLEGEDLADKLRGYEEGDHNPNRVPFSDLDEENKESNRAQAGGYDRILSTRGYAIDLTDDWEHKCPDFDVGDVEEMAKEEHERWCQFKRDWGWRLGPRDDVRRIRPDLVPWTELDQLSNVEEIKERNRWFIRETPELLLRYGMTVKERRRTAAESKAASE